MGEGKGVSGVGHTFLFQIVVQGAERDKVLKLWFGGGHHAFPIACLSCTLGVVSVHQGGLSLWRVRTDGMCNSLQLDMSVDMRDGVVCSRLHKSR